MQLTESDHFLRDEGPFVSWPPSLLEDLLDEVLKSAHYFPPNSTFFSLKNEFDIGDVQVCRQRCSALHLHLLVQVFKPNWR